ncbi:MAG TPA: hypothetical protein VFV83_09495 [Chthoniobacteraceae bacterium]|nr:hypothetical protein [Chthoniobacteraceae bacterium]
MNEFERRLAQQPLRQVPAAWRREVLAYADGARTRISRRATLLDWLWPSPIAWASLVLVWIVLATTFKIAKPIESAMASSSRARIAPTATSEEIAPSLLAYHTRPDLFGEPSRTE